MTAFNSIVSGVVESNPWSCIPSTRNGSAKPPVEVTRQTFTGTVAYEDTNGKVIGKVTVSAPTSAGFTDALTEVMGNSDLETAIGGTATHDALTDKFSTTLRCCHTDGDLYNVTFTRDSVRIASYMNDAVLTAIETWADGISALD
jgi:hypothetical protein